MTDHEEDLMKEVEPDKCNHDYQYDTSDISSTYMTAVKTCRYCGDTIEKDVS